MVFTVVLSVLESGQRTGLWDKVFSFLHTIGAKCIDQTQKQLKVAEKQTEVGGKHTIIDVFSS